MKGWRWVGVEGGRGRAYLGRREAFHVGGAEYVSQIVLQVGDVRVDGDLVLPLEFRPHRPEFGLRASRWLQVVHDVDVHLR